MAEAREPERGEGLTPRAIEALEILLEAYQPVVNPHAPPGSSCSPRAPPQRRSGFAPSTKNRSPGGTRGLTTGCDGAASEGEPGAAPRAAEAGALDPVHAALSSLVLALVFLDLAHARRLPGAGSLGALELREGLRAGRGPGLESADGGRGLRLLRASAWPLLEPEQAARLDAGLGALGDAQLLGVLELLGVEGRGAARRAREVEALGGVYEALLAYRVQALPDSALCVGPARAWISVSELRAVPRARRVKWLQQRGLGKAQATRLARLAPALRSGLDAQALRGAAQAAGVRAAAVAPAGRLVLQPSEQRRRTGSHYTPRALSEPTVARTLEPLLRALGPAPSSAQLLDLKVCDPAMGAGAFLLVALRELAGELERAWAREGKLAELAEQGADPSAQARSLVARRCICGVDKDPFAVRLARRSLWLECGAAELPRAFLDHALVEGDALVGLSRAQLLRLDWADADAGTGLERAERIAALLRRAQQGSAAAREQARMLADCVIGAFFAHARPGERRAELAARGRVLDTWLGAGEGRPAPARVRRWVAQLRAQVQPRPLHWPLEFPELCGGARDKLVAIVGNPPFMAGSSISGQLGSAYLAWLLGAYAPAEGGADYSAYFLRRAEGVLGEQGCCGLIATNTIAQGDTRKTGLQQLEGKIYAAEPSVPWPGSASVSVSIVHIARGPVAAGLAPRLGGRSCAVINSRLRPKPERPDPRPLRANANIYFGGAKIYGQGFVLTPAERERLIASDPRNAERIFAYLGGEELNSSPSQAHHRYVINFGSDSLEQARRWPELLRIVEQRVKPERDRREHDAIARRQKKYWWRFRSDTPRLREALVPRARCLACSQVSKHLVFAFQPKQRVFSHALNLFALDGDAHLGLLQSRVHECWARLLGSSLETRLRYTGSDCFETFPFPPPSQLAPDSELAAIGRRLDAERGRYMLDAQLGLTKLYNALVDPDCGEDPVLELRALHLELDRAVLAAYGWSELEPPPYTRPRGPAEQALRQGFVDELIDRLFVLNAEASAEA